MKNSEKLSFEFKDQIEKLLEDFIYTIYKGHDHIVARKYYRELFSTANTKIYCRGV